MSNSLPVARGATMPDDSNWRGIIGKLNVGDLREFLNEPVLARLATLDRNGWPYVVPCWQEFDGEGFWVIPRERSAWAVHLRDDPRCAITIDDQGGKLRKVAAQCRAELVEEPNTGGQWVPIAERMSTRYLGPNGPKYLEPTLDNPRWLFKLHPISQQTWQGVEWAERYK